MNSVNSKKPMQLRSILYGMWLGALVGGILVTTLQPIFYGDTPWLDVSAVMRNTMVYVLPLVVVASFTLLRLLLRYSLLHFVGFTGARLVAGVVITALYLLANRVLNWFSPASTTSMTYVFCSAVVVAWSVWLMSLSIELIDHRRGVAR